MKIFFSSFFVHFVLLIGTQQGFAAEILYTCEVRPNCTITEKGGARDSFDPNYCETMLGHPQYDSGTCEGGKLNGIIRITKFFSGSSPIYSFLKYKDGSAVIEKGGPAFSFGDSIEIGFYGTSIYANCGKPGVLNFQEKYEQKCEEAKAYFGAQAFEKQNIKRSLFKIRTVKNSEIKQAPLALQDENNSIKSCDEQLTEHNRKIAVKTYGTQRDVNLKIIELYSGVCSSEPGASKNLERARSINAYIDNGNKNPPSSTTDNRGVGVAKSNNEIRVPSSNAISCNGQIIAIAEKYGNDRLAYYRAAKTLYEGNCANDPDAVQSIAQANYFLNKQQGSNENVDRPLVQSNQVASSGNSSQACQQKIVAIQQQGSTEARASRGDALAESRAFYTVNLRQKALFEGECSSHPQARTYVSSAESGIRQWGSKCSQAGGSSDCGAGTSNEFANNTPSRIANGTRGSNEKSPPSGSTANGQHWVDAVTHQCVRYKAILVGSDSSSQWYEYTNICGDTVKVWSDDLGSGAFGSLAVLKSGQSSKSWFSIKGKYAITQLKYFACKEHEGNFDVHFDKDYLKCFYRD